MSKLLHDTLEELSEAARNEDHTDVSEQLKKLLEPLQPDSDLPNFKRKKFTPHDKTVIGQFWRELLKYPPHKDTLDLAADFYSVVLAASVDIMFLALQEKAGAHCVAIELLCKKLLPHCHEEATVAHLPLPARDVPVPATSRAKALREAGHLSVVPITPPRR